MANIKTYVDGSEVYWVLRFGVSYSRDWSQAGGSQSPSASFTIKALPGQRIAQIGQTMEIKLNTTLLWSGTIAAITTTEPLPGGSSLVFFTLQGKDISARLDEVRVWTKYTDQLAGDIIKDLVSTYLTGEGFTTATDVDDGPQLQGTLLFEGVSLRQAFTQVMRRASALEGFVYFYTVEPDKNIIFKPTTDLTAASFNLVDNPHDKYRDLVVVPSTKPYYNIRAYRGGDLEMPSKVFEKTVDTAEAYIDLEERICQINSVTDVTGGGSSALTVGRRGVDKSAPLSNEWLFDYRNQWLSRAEAFGQAEDLATQDLEINACTLANLVIVERNQAEVDARGFVWGTPFSSPSITTLAELVAFARSDIKAASSRTLKRVTYLTYDDGLDVGQSQTMTLAGRRLFGEILVLTRISVSNLPGSVDQFAYAVEAHSSGSPESLQELALSIFGSPVDAINPDTDQPLRVPALMPPDTILGSITFSMG